MSQPCEFKGCENTATVWLENMQMNVCENCFRELGPYANGFGEDSGDE